MTVRNIFNPDAPNVAKMFEPQSGLLYWDEQLPVYYEQYQKMTGNFWIPIETSLAQDKLDWKSKLNEDQKELMRRGISQLVLLDSIASKIDARLANYVENTAVEALINYISSQETIHNESYTYICTSFMTREEAQEVFDRPKSDPQVLEATNDILAVFDEFNADNNPLTFAKALVAMAALEGIRFTNGFVPFYYLNRNNLMQGTGTIINFINRDEAQHSYTQTAIVRDVLTQYPEYNNKDFEDFVYDLFRKVVKAEQALSYSIFEGFTDLDIVEVEMYVEWRANSILSNLGLNKIFDTKRNPMKWIEVMDPNNNNATKVDFFEKRVNNYSKSDNTKNGWDQL